jgi:hypothetical protein
LLRLLVVLGEDMTLRSVPFTLTSPPQFLEEKEGTPGKSATFLECLHPLGQKPSFRMLAFVEYIYIRENFLLFLIYSRGRTIYSRSAPGLYTLYNSFRHEILKRDFSSNPDIWRLCPHTIHDQPPLFLVFIAWLSPYTAK